MLFAPLTHIRPNPWQPRQSFDDNTISALMEDIKERALFANANTNGLMQVPSARLVDVNGNPLPAALVADLNRTLPKAWVDSVYVQLAFGHSRCEAFRRLAQTTAQEGWGNTWNQFPVEIQLWGDEEMARAAWGENSQRRNLNAAEEAEAIQKMITDFGWTQEKAAERLGLNRSTVANKIRLLNLPEDIFARLKRGELSERQALPLLSLEGLPPAVRERIPVEDIIKKAPEMSSGELRAHIKQQTERSTTPIGPQHSNVYQFPLDEDFEGEGVVSAKCKGCENLVTQDGVTRCAVSSCISAKYELWKTRPLIPASEKTGLPIAPASRSWNEYTTIKDKATAEYALEQKCPNVQLITANSWDPQPIEGCPGVGITCAHGMDKRCKCAAALTRAAAKERAGGMSLTKAREVYQNELLQPAAETLAAALRANDEGAWRALCATWTSTHKMEGWTLTDYQAEMARHVLTKDTWEPWRDLDNAKMRITGTLKNAGLDAPWNTGALQKLEANWTLMEQWYTESLKKRRKPEEIEAARMKYLDLRPIVQQCEEEGLLDRNSLVWWEDIIAKRFSALTVLRGFVETNTFDDMSLRLEWLAGQPVESGTFQSNLSAAATSHLHYLEILLRHVEGQRQRRDAIRIELKRRVKEETEAVSAAIEAAR